MAARGSWCVKQWNDKSPAQEVVLNPSRYSWEAAVFIHETEKSAMEASAWKKWWKPSRSYRGQTSPSSAPYFCGWAKPSEFMQRKTRGPPRCSPRGCRESDTTQWLNNNHDPCSQITGAAVFTEIPVCMNWWTGTAEAKEVDEELPACHLV